MSSGKNTLKMDTFEHVRRQNQSLLSCSLPGITPQFRTFYTSSQSRDVVEADM